MTGMIDDAHPDYTDARILLELNDTMHTMFERDVVNSRQGYWLKSYETPTVASRSMYRIPHRAAMGGLEKLEARPSGDAYERLVEVTPLQAQYYEGLSTDTTPNPHWYTVQGDQVKLLPAAADANTTLRFGYYVRPSRLVAQQVASPATPAGLISAVNTTARTLTVNAIPLDRDTGIAIVSGTTRIDVIHPSGWHELALVGATQTYSGTTITVGGTVDMSEIEAGDYVRAAEQTDWPALPLEFHRTLAFATAARIAKARGQYTKAESLFEEVKGDFERFKDMLQPRINNSPRVIVPGNYGPIRGARW